MEVVTENGIVLFGYIDRAKDKRFLMKLEQIVSSSPPTVTVFTNEPIDVTLKQQFVDAENVSNFNDFLRQTAFSVLPTDVKKDIPELCATTFYKAVLSEIENIGLERLLYLSDDFSEMHFHYGDYAGRQHVLKLNLSFAVPLIISSVHIDLPDKLDIDATISVCKLFELFVETVDSCKEFWTELDLLDENESITKNENDTGAGSKTRRLILDKGICVQLTFNPKHPRALPEFSLAGTEEAASCYKTLIDSKMNLWDEEKNIFGNLLELFGPDAFCSGATQRRNVIESHCGICYNYESGKNEIPDQTCLQCKQQFHRSCLYEWLRKQATQRLSFGTVFGPCPYCSQTIKVKLASC